MAALFPDPANDVLRREILDDAGFQRWMGSGARASLVAFGARLNASCVGRPRFDAAAASPAARGLVALLEARAYQ